VFEQSCGRGGLVDAVFGPALIDERFDVVGHLDFWGPGPADAFAGYFGGGVDAHFAAGAEVGCGVVEGVDGAIDQAAVAAGIDVGADVEEDLIGVRA